MRRNKMATFVVHHPNLQILQFDQSTSWINLKNLLYQNYCLHNLPITRFWLVLIQGVIINTLTNKKEVQELLLHILNDNVTIDVSFSLIFVLPHYIC